MTATAGDEGVPSSGNFKHTEEFRCNDAQHLYVRGQGRRQISKICRDAIDEKIARDQTNSLEKLQAIEDDLTQRLENVRKDKDAFLTRKTKEDAANAAKSEHAEKVIENLTVILSDYNYRYDRIPRKVLELFAQHSGKSESELKEILIEIAQKKGVKI